MKQEKLKWKNGVPAVLAILVFLTVELNDLLEIVPLERGKVEQISNGIMFVIAVLGVIGFYLERQASQVGKERNLACIFSNVAVSVIAFYMNVSVFHRTIRLEQLWENIWGIHLCWLLCAVVQIQILSGLGAAILNVVRSFLGGLKAAAKRLWKAVRDTVNRADSYVLCAISLSSFGWAVYICAQIYINGAAFIFADTVVFSRSVWFWAASLFIFLLIRIFPRVIRKAAEGVHSIEGEIMLGAIAVVILAVLSCVLPSFPQAIAILVLIPLTAICILWLTIRKLSQPQEELKNGSHEGSSDTGDPDTGTQEDGRSDEGITIKRSDLAAVILPFAVPLVMIFIITALQLEDGTILETQDSLDVNAWLSFINEAAEVAQTLLGLFM